MRFVKIVFGAVLVTTAFLTMGCTNLTMLRTQELRAVQSEVDSLRAELTRMQGEMLQEQKKQGEMLRLVRADQVTRFNEMQREIASLEQVLSESQFRLSKIDEKTQEIKKAWEEKARVDSMAEASQDAEIQGLFDVAYGDFMAGRYDVAEAGFADIIDRFPQSRQAREAAYWRAESYYVRKQNEKALKAYLNYIKSYPEGEKSCAALYKAGLIYDRTGKEKSRKMVWDKLQSQCPGSEEAAAARAARQN